MICFEYMNYDYSCAKIHFLFLIQLFFMFFLYLCTMVSESEKIYQLATRDSNIELLRIFSMILVLVSHASYTSLDSPTQYEISTSLYSVFLRGISESLSVVCVNVFVLISGWYGIKVRPIRFVELIFQVLFVSLTIYLAMRILGLTQSMNLNEWIELLLIKHRGYWFVKAYIILYLFAPLLNVFVQNVNRDYLKTFLIAFFTIQIVYGFYHYGGWYAGGYSPLSFMGLYVLARYMRLYPNKYTQFNKFLDLLLYLIISVSTALCSLALTYIYDKGGTVLFLYSSPLVILASVFFFLFFTKLSFYSKILNWVAASCFAVYLVHNSPYIFHSYYIDNIKHWYTTESNNIFMLYTSGLLTTFFILSILFDKIRIMLWNFVVWAYVTLKR